MRLSARVLLRALTALLLLLTAAGCGLTGGGARTITALLPDSAGLFTGNDVGVLGVKVGHITAITPEGDHVKVTMQITDGDVNIPADAGAAVVARSVATDRYVELTPVYHSGPKMADGATIPMQRTVTPVDFDQVLASLKDFGDGLVNNPKATNGLKELISVAADNLDGRGKQLNRTITSLASAVQAVEGQSDNIFGTMRSLDVLTQALSKDQATVRAFVRNVADASELLSSERNNLGRALTTLSQAVDDLSGFAKDNRAAIKTDIVGITAVMRNILASRTDFEQVLNNFPLATDNLARAAAPSKSVRVRTDLAQVLPVGSELLKTLCQALGTACDLSDPLDSGDLLGGLLGGQGTNR